MDLKTGIRMIFVDLDGTLLQGVDTVSPRTISAFEQVRAKGILPVIATGRIAYEADFASRAIGADGYLIAMNGLAVYEDYRAGKLLYEAYMQKEATDQIITLLRKKQVFFQAYAGNRACCQADRVALIHSCGMDEEHIRFFSGTMRIVEDLKAYLTEKDLNVNKFFVSVAREDEAVSLREELEGIKGVKTFHLCGWIL